MSFSSPYNFVPLTGYVHTPLAQKITQDSPLEEGISGVLEIEITNLNPLMIGDHETEQDDAQPFFKTPDNRPAIPGTSIKGMLRSLLESATGSAIQMDDNLFSQRDLTKANNEYMTTLKNKSSGWLKWDKENNAWFIFPTKDKYKTIRHSHGISHNQKNANTDVEPILEDLLRVSPAIHEIEEAQERYKAILKAKPKANKIGACAEVLSDKYLVVSNQLEGCSKRREFLFSAPGKQGLEVSEEVFQKFVYVMDESQTKIGSGHWNYLKQFDSQGIPVFFIKQDKEIKAFGLASLFRLPYEKRLYDLIPNSHRPENTVKSFDFSRLLFGDIGQDDLRTISRKGRVSFGLCKTQSVGTYDNRTVLLNNPKPSYYPAYLKQREGQLDNFNKSNQINGFKRYLPHQNLKSSTLNDENTNVQKNIQVLTSTHTFKGKVRVHNITPVELGALMWALTLDEENNNQYVHLLGMAKPLGYGKVKIKLAQQNLYSNNSEQLILNPQDYIALFYQYLAANDLFNDNFATLKASMRLGVKPENELHYLKLDPKKKDDEFSKKKNNNQRLGDLNTSIEEEFIAKVKQTYAAEIDTLQTLLKEQENSKLQKEKLEIELAEQAERDAENATKQAELEAQKSDFERLFENDLKGEINKAALNTLIDKPELYQSMQNEDKQALKNRIEANPWFRGLKRKRSKWRDQLPDLLK